MKRFLLTLLLVSGGFAFLHAIPPVFNVEIKNTASDKEINEMQVMLKKRNVQLVCNRIRRDKSGHIVRMHIRLVCPQGTVDGRYANFSSIRLYENEDREMGIIPLSLSEQGN